MQNSSCPRTVAAAGHLSRVDLSQPPGLIASVMGLLDDAKAMLNSDDESACECLRRAITLLHQRSTQQRAEPAGGGLTTRQVALLTTHIDQHLHAPLKTRELACVLELSVSYFSHAFKQRMGIAPAAYVAQRRIAAARQMMLATDEPLTTIAHLHGFCDQSHFTKAFRRETGLAPQAWRRLRGARAA